MFTRLLLALVLAPLAFGLFAGTATAAEVTEADLRAKLITTAEFKREIDKAGSTLTFGNAREVSDISTDAVVRAGRRWVADDGAIVYVVLQAYNDGRQLTPKDRDDLMSGYYAREVMGGAFTSFEELDEPEEFFDADDVLQVFEAKGGGKDWQVLTVTFISGTLSGIMMYATPNTNRGIELGAAYGAQWVKLNR